MSEEFYIERPRWTCALGGALAAAGTLPDTVPILHAGPGCAGNFAWTNNGASALNVTGPSICLSVPATNLQEGEVVFGGLERLREEIVETIQIMKGELYFVLTGCLPEVIGDDVPSLINELNSTKYPLVMSSTPGFKGDSYVGYGEVI
jgi:nitrogenase molybdenum-iron protein beta chain